MWTILITIKTKHKINYSRACKNDGRFHKIFIFYWRSHSWIFNFLEELLFEQEHKQISTKIQRESFRKFCLITFFTLLTSVLEVHILTSKEFLASETETTSSSSLFLLVWHLLTVFRSSLFSKMAPNLNIIVRRKHRAQLSWVSQPQYQLPGATNEGMLVNLQLLY